MIKTILMLQKRRIPKQANFTRLNPKITLQTGEQICIPVESRDWKAQKRVAMVTNYGAAGSNVAMVLQEPTYTSRSPMDGYRECLPSAVPFFVAARTEESIREYCKALQTTILDAAQLNNGTVQDIAFNLARKQNRDMEYSVTFTTVSGNYAELREGLEGIVSGRTRIEKKNQAAHPVVLCFGGQTGNTASISKSVVESSELLRFHVVSLLPLSRSESI
jgi:acyl transferase domain-containing protein